jgi:CheY-like chemotaxis protein
MSLDHDARRYSILIAEDEAMLRMIAGDMLRDVGYDVVEAADGAAGLEILQSDALVDLLISDIKMPRMNGYQLVEAALALRPEMRAMLMTGYAQEPVPDAIKRAGIAVIYKPFDLDDLAALARKVLAAPR